jgi:predicted glycosyltransferase
MVYCHDLFGLGNVRRMLEYSHHLRAAYPKAAILFVLGSSKIDMFALPSGMDKVKLPELSRRVDGKLAARALDWEEQRVLQMRKSILQTCVRAFEPEALIIDKKPLGANGELADALAALSPDCARILVLRDILDAPERTVADMAANAFHDAVRAHIDQIQILGEQAVFDVARSYAFPGDVARLVHYAGYVVPQDVPQSRVQVLETLGLNPALQTVFVTVGGGEDGAEVLKLAGQAASQDQNGAQFILLSGPNLSDNDFKRLRAITVGQPHVVLLRASTDVASLINAADVVVSMAGYNSVCALLAAGKPCVLVPRTEPSLEQFVRARMLSQRGLAVALPKGADAAALRSAITRATLQRASPALGFQFDRERTTARIASGLSAVCPAPKTEQQGASSCIA